MAGGTVHEIVPRCKLLIKNKIKVDDKAVIVTNEKIVISTACVLTRGVIVGDSSFEDKDV